jgi:peroxiredoxin
MPKIGESIAPLVASDDLGHVVTYDFKAEPTPTIVYIFTPKCGWCARNLANIKSIAAQTPGRYQVLGLSLTDEGLKDYVSRSNITFPYLSDPAPNTIAALRFGGTPATFVIDSAGHLQKMWAGAYVGDEKLDVERSLAVTLPGVTDIKASVVQ